MKPDAPVPQGSEGALRRGSHLPVLDGLRGLAIMLVMFAHFLGAAPKGSELERVLFRYCNHGVFGVDLFFVLSGFLITGILYDSRGSRHYFRNFYMRRFLRIFPLYYAVLFLIFFIWPLAPALYPAGLQESSRHQAWLWTYGVNIFLAQRGSWESLPFVGHFWSLAVEEHFYLFWPIVVGIASQNTLLRICTACALFSLVLRIGLTLLGMNEISIYVLTPSRLDALCIGAFLAVASRSNLREPLTRMVRPALLVLAASVLIVSVGSAAKLFPGVLHAIRSSLVALFFGALLIFCIHSSPADRIVRFFNHSALRFFGKYSYGIYVFQGIISYLLNEKVAENAATGWVRPHLLLLILRAAAGVGLSVLIAVVSYDLYERRFLRLKRWFGEARAPVPRPQAPAELWA